MKKFIFTMLLFVVSTCGFEQLKANGLAFDAPSGVVVDVEYGNIN